MITPRPYQEACVQAVLREFQTVKSTLAVMPTGVGKTVSFGMLARDWSGNVLILVHRQELAFQAQERFVQLGCARPEIEMGILEAATPTSNGLVTHGEWGPEIDYHPPERRVIIGSVQTMSRLRRATKFPKDYFSLIIIDEAHHATATTYQRVCEAFDHPGLRILGVTATPDRADEEALGKVFESVAFDYELPDAISDGWLTPIEQRYCVITNLDLSSVHTLAGDLHPQELESEMTKEKNLHGVVNHTIEYAGNRPTLVFAASVEHAHRMAEIFNRHRSGSAMALDAKSHTDFRREVLGDFSSGRFQYLVNMGLFLEGYDEVSIGCVAMARPTKSRALYSQATGRSTRPLKGVVDNPAFSSEDRRFAIAASAKPNTLILDFVGNSGRHKLISAADILGGKYSDETVERAKRNAKKANDEGQAANVQEELSRAEQQLAEEEAARRRQRIKVSSTCKTQIINPFDLFDIRAKHEPGWFKGKRPTARMAEFLHSAGIAADKLTFWEAKQLIGTVIDRRNKGMASAKQVRLLRSKGYTGPDPTFKEASELINQIAANGWRNLAS